MCVGIDSVAHLRECMEMRFNKERRITHVTRMTPRRRGELLAGGSLYWVIKRQVQARQKLLALEPVTGSDGINRCALVLDPEIVATRPQPRRAFQGWRYLAGDDAPADLPRDTALDDMPATMREELLELGLI